MSLDPELLKQLLESFKTELDEHVQAITNGLLQLEKNNLSEDEYNQTIETIFRLAHNIKGTAYTLGINRVGETAHSIESLFSEIQKKTQVITPKSIDACLESMDKIRNAFDEFIQKKDSPTSPSSMKNKLSKKSNRDTHEYDSIRVPKNRIEKISSLLEEMQINKISFGEYYSELSLFIKQSNQFSDLWKQILLSIQESSLKNIPENTRRLYSTSNDYFLEMDKSIHTTQKNMIL